MTEHPAQPGPPWSPPTQGQSAAENSTKSYCCHHTKEQGDSNPQNKNKALNPAACSYTTLKHMKVSREASAPKSALLQKDSEGNSLIKQVLDEPVTSPSSLSLHVSAEHPSAHVALMLQEELLILAIFTASVTQKRGQMTC